MTLTTSSRQRVGAGAVMTAFVICSLAPAHGQESVNKELDACIRKQQMISTGVGAVVGGLLGFMKAKSSDNKDNTGKNVIAGAAVGGALGFATAYFTAVGTCYKKNPSWVPESKIERGSDYALAKAEVGYAPEMGLFAKTMQVNLASQVKPGGSLKISSRFVALTPDGSEADVTIERRLFVVADGKETEMPFPGHMREQRKVPAGGSIDEANLPIPSNMPVGTTFRYQFSVSAGGKAASAQSGNTTVS